ncbi:MAG: hypothetical protein AAB596_02835 [Patescibacteria group bacterium]
MTILIKNASIADGTGKPAFRSDVLIKNGKISAIEPAIDYQADETINGLGYYLAPGFIDINNHADQRLEIFTKPKLENYLSQGITTIIGGQNGFSLAPIIYGSLQSISSRANLNKINVDWHNFSEFIKILSAKPIGVNFGSFAGYTTLRREIINESVFRNLTDNELRVLNSIVEKSLKEGAFGVSIDLDHPIVGEASYFEIKKIAQSVAKLKGVLAINIKNKLIKPLKSQREELIESVKRLIYLAKETGAKILINDFFPLVGLRKEFDLCIKLIEQNYSSAGINFNLYPYEKQTMPLRSFLPDWAKSASRKSMAETIKNPENRKKILKELPLFKGEDVIIISAPTREYLEGKTLKEFSQNRNLSSREGILALMELTEFRAEVLYKNINLATSLKTIKREESLISSNGLTEKYQPFKKFLESAEVDNLMPIELAIKKISFLPALKLNIPGRGMIKPGYFADLTMFKNGEISEVIVGGQRAIKEGKATGIMNGRALKSGR